MRVLDYVLDKFQADLDTEEWGLRCINIIPKIISNTSLDMLVYENIEMVNMYYNIMECDAIRWYHKTLHVQFTYTNKNDRFTEAKYNIFSFFIFSCPPYFLYKFGLGLGFRLVITNDSRVVCRTVPPPSPRPLVDDTSTYIHDKISVPPPWYLPEQEKI